MKDHKMKKSRRHKPRDNKIHLDKRRPDFQITPNINVSIDTQKFALEQTYGCIDTLVDIMVLFGFTGKANLKKTYEHWAKLVVASDFKWMKVAKFKIASFFSYWYDQPIPACPYDQVLLNDNSRHLFGGRVGRFVQGYLMRNQGRDLESRMKRAIFCNTVLQSKKGMPRPSEGECKAEEKTYADTMTTDYKENVEVVDLEGFMAPKGAAWADWEEDEDNDDMIVDNEWEALDWEDAEHEIIRTVKELFNNTTYSLSDRIKKLFPSTSANYIRSRSDMGAVGEILSDPTLLTDLRRPGGYLVLDDRDRPREIWPGPMPLEETRDESDRQESKGLRMGRIDTTDLDAAWSTLWFRMLKRAQLESKHVTPNALPEALKIRVITKGAPYRATVLKPLQQFMHSTLRKNPCFALIGEPVTAKFILERLGAGLREDESFLSGDYKGATNSILKKASKLVATTIAETIGLSKIETELFVQGLVDNELEVDGVWKEQTIGQLMGDITSFPVLCILNAAMSRMAIEASYKAVNQRREVLLRDTRMMINGDDILVKGLTGLMPVWEHCTGLVGLQSSIGKTFNSREFVNINSTNYLYCPEDPEEFIDQNKDGGYCIRKNPYRRTHIINMGLISGLKRAGGGQQNVDNLDPFDNMGARYRELINTCPPTLKEEVHRAFMKSHKEILSKTTLPYYIPEWLGGLGLTGLKEPSETDRRIAGTILSQNGHPDHTPKNLSNLTVGGWKSWELASKSLPRPYKSVDKKSTGVQQWKSIMTAQVINQLFNSNVGLGEFFSRLEADRSWGYFKQMNERLWRTSSYTKLARPITDLSNESFDSFVDYGSRRGQLRAVNDLKRFEGKIPTKEDVTRMQEEDVKNEFLITAIEKQYIRQRERKLQNQINFRYKYLNALD